MLIKQVQKKEVCHEMLDVKKSCTDHNTKVAPYFAVLSAIHYCMLE